MSAYAGDEDLLEREHQPHRGAHARPDAGRSISNLYHDAARQSWKVIASCLVVGLALGWLAATLATPQYRTTSQVFVSFQSADDSSGSMLQGASFTQQQVISYADIVTSPLVLQPVIDNLGLEEDAEDLADRVEATTRKETVLIDIAVTDTSPTAAAVIADEIAASLGEVIAQLERPAATTRPPVHVTTTRPAVVPTSPSAPNSTFIIAVGGALGLSVGVAYSYFAQLRRT